MKIPAASFSDPRFDYFKKLDLFLHNVIAFLHGIAYGIASKLEPITDYIRKKLVDAGE